MRKISCLLIFFTLTVLPLDISYANFNTPKNPNSARECAICHYRWIDTFFLEGKGSDLVPYHSEKVAATPEMCFSCHDGSVKDSRTKWDKNYGHKTNMTPPAHMKIPEMFPLDESGRVQCSTCHTAHGVPSGGGTHETIFMRVSNKNSAMCAMCHADKDGGRNAGNHPMGSMKQEMPDKLISQGAVTGNPMNQVICETCHTAHGSHFEGLLVEGAGNSGLCLDCHNDKNIFTPEGKRKPFHVINVPEGKSKIPQALLNKGAKLGYNGIIICQTCHKVHNNKTEKQLLLIKKEDESTFCLTCHKDKKYLKETKHNLARTAPNEKNLAGKTASESGMCSACHLPHASARKLSGKGDFTTQLCLSCHTQGNVAEKVLITGTQHPLNVNPYEKIDSLVPGKNRIRLPLFSASGASSVKGNITCATCHDPHGSNVVSAMANSSNQVNAGDDKTFLRRHQKEICIECHRDKNLIANSKHDLSKVAPETKNILGMTPSASGLCGSCHLVHSGQKTFLWARELNFQSKNPVQDICISCHNENGMAGKKTIKDYSHPVNVSPFEKGLATTLPLFDRSGKKSKKGLVTCLTCHEPHRWDPLKIIGSDHHDIEGNTQNSFLRLQASPAPKLCENCHPDKAYIEKTDHDLRVTNPASKNIKGQTPAESGVCGVCHLVHNSENWARIWAQNFGTGENLMDMMCNSCHSCKGSAKNKVPKVSSHPQDKLINSVSRNVRGRVDFFPVFHKNYGEPVTMGNISCPSCHDAHQWDAGVRAKGSGSNIEGNATNSFLRSRSSIRPCKDCHGADSLFRYKYFHKAEERRNKINSPKIPNRRRPF